jgi:uncharacterized small protein (DUF1192 family)
MASAIVALPLPGSLHYVVGIARTGRIGDMALFEEELPKKRAAHEIGEDLGKLSVDELGERIAILKGEIERLEAAVRLKRESADQAQSFFKR